MADKEKEATGENLDDGGSKAMLGVVLGMVLAMALGLGAVVMFSGGEAPTEGDVEGEGENISSESEEVVKPIKVQMKGIPFVFAETNLKRKGLIEIKFFVELTDKTPGADLPSMFGEVIDDVESIYPLKEFDLKVLVLRQEIKSFFSSKSPKFLDRMDEQTIAEREIVPMLMKLFAVKNKDSAKPVPPLATVTHCFLTIKPF